MLTRLLQQAELPVDRHCLQLRPLRLSSAIIHNQHHRPSQGSRYVNPVQHVCVSCQKSVHIAVSSKVQGSFIAPRQLHVCHTAFVSYCNFHAQAVAALLQTDTSAVVTLKSSGIDRPRKLDGQTYASYGARFHANKPCHHCTCQAAAYLVCKCSISCCHTHKASSYLYY